MEKITKRLYLGKKNSGFYELGTSKKDWSGERGFKNFFLAMYCPKVFKRLTGIKLKPGELRKVKSIDIKLEEEDGRQEMTKGS